MRFRNLSLYGYLHPEQGEDEDEEEEEEEERHDG